MALGNPISLTNNVASRLVSATATAGQTTFTVSGGYRINAISVYRNGVKLSDNEDFTASDGSTVTLVNAASLSDTISFEIFDDFRVADAIVSAASSQTVSGNLTVTGDVVPSEKLIAVPRPPPPPPPEIEISMVSPVCENVLPEPIKFSVLAIPILTPPD